MAEQRSWAIGSDQYVKRLGNGTRARTESSVSLPTSASAADQLEATGITYDRSQVEWEAVTESTVDRVRARYQTSLPEYIWDAAVLEGNPYTLPEVQTLLEGVTVSGHRLEDQDQILALNEAYNTVDTLVGEGRFRLDKDSSDLIHGQVAVHEAIESGHFRGEGRVGGGALVGLGALGTFQASGPGENGTTLLTEFDSLLEYLDDVEDPRERALVYFCAATRRQFYFDGNKRTARLMMIGQLMSRGFDAISISARRRLEFNDKLGRLFDTGQATEMLQFLIDCRPAA
jgi:hypothetical protein